MDQIQFLSSPFFFTLLLFILMAFRIRNKLKMSNSTANLPPGPWKLPLIGHLYLFVGSQPHRRLRDLARRYGPLMHLQLGEISSVVISGPSTAKEMMKTHDINFAQRNHLFVSSILLGNSVDIIFAPYGDYWRQLRKICTSQFLSPGRVQSFQSIREVEVSNLIRSISSNAREQVNLSKMLFSFSYSLIARVAFGKKCKDQDAFMPIAQEIMESGGGFSIGDVFPSLKFLHVISGLRSRLEWLRQEADKILENIINDHRASRAIAQAGDVEAHDLVHVLLDLQAHEDLEIPLTDDNIKAIILDIFIAGSEASSTTVEWAMSELLKRPRLMEKAQAEVRRVFDKEETVSETGLDELKFLKLVVKETLRLHPPVLLIPRESREKCVINGFEIPAKTKVFVNLWAIGTDSEHWTEADSFCPERFLDISVDYKGVDFEYIPFGAGRRICPGMTFGIVSVELLLANLLYHFDWKLPGGTKQEDLDMTEAFGGTVRRRADLFLIPVPY